MQMCKLHDHKIGQKKMITIKRRLFLNKELRKLGYKQLRGEVLTAEEQKNSDAMMKELEEKKSGNNWGHPN